MNTDKANFLLYKPDGSTPLSTQEFKTILRKGAWRSRRHRGLEAKGVARWEFWHYQYFMQRAPALHVALLGMKVPVATLFFSELTSASGYGFQDNLRLCSIVARLWLHHFVHGRIPSWRAEFLRKTWSSHPAKYRQYLARYYLTGKYDQWDVIRFVFRHPERAAWLKSLGVRISLRVLRKWWADREATPEFAVRMLPLMRADVRHPAVRTWLQENKIPYHEIMQLLSKTKRERHRK